MAITEELHRLGNSARRLNAGSDQLNRLIERIDQLLSSLMIGLDYVHPRPIDESTTSDHNGKRVIELSYVGYLRTNRSYHLAIKTVKVLESKLALATQNPGEITALLAAPRRLRYAAVDLLPEVVHGLAEQVDEMVGSLERRCATAESLVQHLEQIASGHAGQPAPVDESGSRKVIPPDGSTTRGQTMPGADPRTSESSGGWVVPASMSQTAGIQPQAPVHAQPQPPAHAQPHAPVEATPGQPDERRSRTIAMGSDQLKG